METFIVKEGKYSAAQNTVACKLVKEEASQEKGIVYGPQMKTLLLKKSEEIWGLWGWSSDYYKTEKKIYRKKCSRI